MGAFLKPGLLSFIEEGEESNRFENVQEINCGGRKEVIYRGGKVALVNASYL